MNTGFRETIRWAATGGGRAEHKQTHECQYMGCGYVVEEHQKWGKPEAGEVPEFTIEVTYKNRDRNGSPLAATPIEGYRYVLKWLENGQQKQERGYGFASKEDAVTEAKAESARIAKSLAPVHVETYRPEF